MPTTVELPGKRVAEIDLVGLFEASEGMIAQYYGRIGQGKTYNATADILEDLSRGEVVYANWRLHYSGFDQRESLVHLAAGLIFFRERYYKFPPQNLRYIDLDENFLDNFEKLTDCKVYLDEGHVAFDSYEMAKMSLRKRKAVLHTRHFNRTICIISQRPTAVHVSMRANVNVFYKCEKLMSWPFLVFRRTEYQDLTGETVDETKPVSTKIYLAKKSVLNSYNSKYLRGGIPASQRVFFEAYDLTFSERFRSFLSVLRSSLRALRPQRGPKAGPAAAPSAEYSEAEAYVDQAKSLGVEPGSATIKNVGGLNTTDVGERDQQNLPF